MSNKLRSNRKQKESMATAVKQFLRYLLDGMICVYMLLIIAVMPFYHEEGFARIGTNKAMFFRGVSVNGAKYIIPVVILYLIFAGVEKIQQQKRTPTNRKHLSVTDMFALLYGISLLLSYLFSDYKDMALWGADGWYMGLLPQLFLLGIYFMVSKLWKTRNWMYLLFLPVSAVVFALGYLNRFGIFPIDMKIDNPSYLSTIGNINWYCGYIVSVFFGGYYLLWQSDSEQKNLKLDKKEAKFRWVKNILLIAYVAVGFSTLVTQGSMSGLVALAVMLVVTFCMSAREGSKMLRFWESTLILSLVCVATWCLQTVGQWKLTIVDPYVNILTKTKFPMITAGISLVFVIGVGLCNHYGKYSVKLFSCVKWIVGGGAILGVCLAVTMIVMNTLHPGCIGELSQSPIFTFSDKWGSNRGATWKAGWMCFAEQNLLHKIIGVGPDAMEGFISNGASEGLKTLVTGNFGTSRLTNAHCEWLTILVNNGLLGIVGFVGMVVSAIVRFIRCGKVNVIAGACGFCLLAYTVNNIFSFQQSMSVATIFVILGIGEAYAGACASFDCYTMVKMDNINQ